MAVALSNYQGNVQISGTSIDISYASGSGADRLLLVQTTAFAHNVTGVNYAGNALTFDDDNSGQKLHLAQTH